MASSSSIKILKNVFKTLLTCDDYRIKVSCAISPQTFRLRYRPCREARAGGEYGPAFGRNPEGLGLKRSSGGKIVLRELKISPCLEIYNCLKDGQCAIKDDMTALYDRLIEARILIVATPIFFYGPSAQLKAVIDRCQALWSRKYILGLKNRRRPGRGYLLSVGATGGKRLFEGLLLTIKYFFDVLDLKFGGRVLARGVDKPGEILDKPEFLSQARAMGEAAAEFMSQS